MQNYLFEDLQKQLSPELLDAELQEKEKQQLREKSDLCFLFTSSFSGGFGGIRFLVTENEAKIFCSDERSKGIMHGGKWAYFYTTIANSFYNQGEQIKLSEIIDNGKYDWLLDELGIKKIPKQEWRDLLTPFGFEII